MIRSVFCQRTDAAVSLIERGLRDWAGPVLSDGTGRQAFERVFTLYAALKFLAQLTDRDAGRVVTPREVCALGLDYCRGAGSCRLPYPTDTAARLALEYLTQLGPVAKVMTRVRVGDGDAYQLTTPPERVRSVVVPAVAGEALTRLAWIETQRAREAWRSMAYLDTECVDLVYRQQAALTRMLLDHRPPQSVGGDLRRPTYRIEDREIADAFLNEGFIAEREPGQFEIVDARLAHEHLTYLSRELETYPKHFVGWGGPSAW